MMDKEPNKFLGNVITQELDLLYQNTLHNILGDKDIPELKKDELIRKYCNCSDLIKDKEKVILEICIELNLDIREFNNLVKTKEEEEDILVKDEIVLPQKGSVLISDFIKNVIRCLKKKGTFFYREADNTIVQYQKGRLRTIKPPNAVSLIEKYCIPGITEYNKYINERVFKKKSANENQCSALLSSNTIREELPIIKKILTVPIPFLTKGKLHFPLPGYNKESKLYLEPSAPKINMNIPLDKAKEYLMDLHKEFCFKDKDELLKCIMSLLTPFCRGLYEEWTSRTPIFIYFANRERAGKDFLAGIRLIVFCGFAIENPPVSTGNKYNNNNEELRKKILSTLMIGGNMMHFSNNKGFINNPILEQATTSPQWTDRILGKNDVITFDNILEFSLSGNIGTTLTPDIANRSIIIQLHLAMENANERKFKTPYLHNKIKEERGHILGCLYSFVKEWYDKGMPKSSVPFASFPEWAAICGGIMESVGFVNPLTKGNAAVISLDVEVEDMKETFKQGYEAYPDVWFPKENLKHMIKASDDLFTYLDLDKKSGQTRLGLIIEKYVGRELGGITFRVDETTKRKSRQNVILEKVNVKEMDI